MKDTSAPGGAQTTPVANSTDGGVRATVRRKAEQGDCVAQIMLAHYYSSGKEVPKDDAGTGVSKDYEEAVKWFRVAAERGDAKAQFALGECYHFGVGVPKHYKQAHLWLYVAGASGHQKAREALGEINELTSPKWQIEAVRAGNELIERLSKASTRL